jgi:ATP-dependent DNA helicase PIF1
MKETAIPCASTGIASILLAGGSTAHKAFSISNDVDFDTPSRISYESEYGKKLREAKLIIIDEVTMLHKDVLNYINRTLQDVSGAKGQLFGGKVVIIGGDWKQLLPVIEGLKFIANIS